MNPIHFAEAKSEIQKVFRESLQAVTESSWGDELVDAITSATYSLMDKRQALLRELVSSDEMSLKTSSLPNRLHNAGSDLGIH